ncbi:hypothetical protein LXL04_036617 [Taraxacum kok-saghyz]
MATMTAARRQRILIRALHAGVLCVLVRTVYLIITTTPTTAPTSMTTTRQSSWKSDTDEQLVKYYSSIFQDLIAEGFLTVKSRTLIIGAESPQCIAALRESGIKYSKSSKKNVRFPFMNNSFDLQFSSHSGLDSSSNPGELSSELSRTLKQEGYLVIHTESKGSYSLNSLLELFDSFKLIRSHEVPVQHWSIPRIREVVLKKQNGVLRRRMNLPGSCSVPAYKKELIQNSEPLIAEEPLKPWISLKRNLKNIKYLPSMADISFKTRYIYIDVGAKSYGSSIGSWFKKLYPKQNKPFKIFAIESNKRFHQEYKSKKKITLLPYAAWVRNESLFFEINREPNSRNEDKGRGMGRVQSAQTSTSFLGDLNKIQGLDFPNWVKNSFTEKDFVVVKMDVEGTEFDLIRKMVDTGAICLIDEMFLKCHYNRWQRCCKGERSSKYQNGYSECMELFSSLREKGVLVHQWGDRRPPVLHGAITPSGFSRGLIAHRVTREHSAFSNRRPVIVTPQASVAHRLTTRTAAPSVSHRLATNNHATTPTSNLYPSCRSQFTGITDEEEVSSSTPSDSHNSTWGDEVEMDIEQLMTKHFEMDMGSCEGNLNKTELDKYLGEDREAMDVNFDILKWWGINKCRYPVLSKMAQDVLAIPVSRVASELAFSTGGRVLDSFRTSVTPRMVEALVCTQDWVGDCLKDLTVDQRTIITDETVDGLAENIREWSFVGSENWST